MGRDRVDVQNGDKSSFEQYNVYLNQVQDSDANGNPQVGASQPGAPEGAEGAEGAPVNAQAQVENEGQGTQIRTVNAQITRAKDVALQQFEVVLAPKLKDNGTTVAFADTLDGASETTNLASRKGYVRFRHVKNSGGQKGLGLDRVTKWLWLPFSWRTNISDARHNRAMRETFYASMLEKFKGVSVPSDLMGRITGNVKEVDWEGSLALKSQNGVQGYTLSGKNQRAALEANEVSQTLYRYNTVLNTTQARREIVLESLRDVIRATDYTQKAITTDRIFSYLETMNLLPAGADRQNYVEMLIDSQGENGGVSLKSSRLTDEGTISGTQEELRQSADEFLGQVTGFVGMMKGKIREAVANHNVKDTLSAVNTLAGLADTWVHKASELLGDTEIANIHENMCAALEKLSPDEKTELGIDKMTGNEVRNLVACFCQGDIYSGTTKTPLKAVLDGLQAEFGIGANGGDGLGDRKVDFNSYFAGKLCSFIKSYNAISNKIDAGDGQGNADDPFSRFSKSIEEKYSETLKTWNDNFTKSCREAFGDEYKVEAPLSHQKILKDVLMGRFYRYFHERMLNQAESKGERKDLDGVVAKINQSDSSHAAEDLSDDFIEAFLTDYGGKDAVQNEVASSYSCRIANELAKAVCDQRIEHNVTITDNDVKIVDYSVGGFVTAVGDAVLDILKDNQKISDEQKKKMAEAGKGQVGVFQQAMAAWHKVSFAKNAFYLAKNAVGFKVGGIFTIANSVKNVGMSAWTLKTDIVNYFTDKNKQGVADASLKTHIADQRKAMSRQAFDVEEDTSIVSMVQSAMTSAAAAKMLKGMVDSVKGKVEKNNADDKLLTPLMTDKNAEWESSGAAVLDMAMSVQRLTEDIQKEISSLQKGPFTLFGIHIPLFDDNNAEAGFENQLADRLKNVDNKTLAKHLGFAYSAVEADTETYKAQRKMLLQICTARYVDSLSLAMQKTVDAFAGEVADSYLVVHDAVMQSKGEATSGQIPGALVRPATKGGGYTLTTAGKAKLRNIAIRFFSEAYQENIEHVVGKITGQGESKAAAGENQNLNPLARDLAELEYDALGRDAFAQFFNRKLEAFRKAQKDPDATIDQMMWRNYPSVMMFHKTAESAKLAMMGGFVKRIYNEAILANYSKEGVSGLTLMKKAGDVEKGTFADKVRSTFNEQFAKNVENYLKGTEDAFSQAFQDYDEEFFDMAGRFFDDADGKDVVPANRVLLNELKEMVRPNGNLDEKGKKFFDEILRLTFATWGQGQKMLSDVNAFRDEARMKTLDATAIDSVCRTAKFVNALLAKYAEMKENWGIDLDRTKRELSEGLLDGKDMIDRIFQSVSVASNSVEERKFFLGKLFTAFVSAVKGTKGEKMLASFRKELGLNGAVTDVGQQEALLKKMLAADRPFLALVRKALKQEIDTEIRPNMVKYGGSGQTILDCAKNNVAQKIWDFIPQFRKNWERLSTYDRYLSEALKPAEGGAQAVQEAVEEVSWMMYQDFKDITQERDALQDGTQPKGATAELKNLDRNVDISGNLDAYYEKFVEIRDKFVKGKEGKAGVVAARREALLNDETVGGELRTTVAESVDGLLAAVKNLSAQGENNALANQGEALKEHAVWVLATKIASRCVSVEEVARLLAEPAEEGKAPNWLRKLVNGVIAKIADSVKALSVKSLLAERGLDEGAILRPNLSLAAFQEAHPGVAAYTHTPTDGLTLTDAARAWLKEQIDEAGAWLKRQTGSNQGVVGETFVGEFADALSSAAPARPAGVATDGAAEAPFVAMGESEFAAIFDKICREKMPTLDDAILKLDPQTVVNGVWTGNDPSVAANLQTAVIHHCLVALDDDLETGVDIDQRAAVPVVDGAEEMEKAAQAYRLAFADPNAPLEQIASEFKVKDHLADILLRRMKETAVDQIKATFLKEVEFEKQLPKDERYFTSQLNAYRDQYAKQVNQTPEDWTDEMVLAKYLNDQLSAAAVKDPDLERLYTKRIGQGGDSFDRISYDYFKYASVLTYAQLIGQVDAAWELKRVLELEVEKGLAVSVDARVNVQVKDLNFAQFYEANYHAFPAGYYVKSLIKAFISHVENVDFRDRNDIGFQRQEDAFRKMRKKLRGELGKIREEYGRGYEAELVQRHAMLTGFDGVRAFFKSRDPVLKSIIHERALEAYNNVWLQKTMSKTGDVGVEEKLVEAVSVVLNAETLADKPGEFKKLYEGYQNAHRNLLKVKSEVETDTARIGKDKFEKHQAAEKKVSEAADIQAKAQEDNRRAQVYLGEMQKQLEEAKAKYAEKETAANEANARFAEARKKHEDAVKEAGKAQKNLDGANATLETAQKAQKAMQDELNKIVSKMVQGKRVKAGASDDLQKKVFEKTYEIAEAEKAVAECLRVRDDAEKVKAEAAANLEAEGKAQATATNELKEALTVKTTAEASVNLAQNAVKKAANALKSATEELGSAQKKFADQPFQQAKARDAEAREALNAYVRSQKFTKDDLAYAKEVVGRRIDEKKVRDYENFIWKNIDEALVQLVKVAHDPETFFSQKDWWLNGKVFGLLPIHSQIETSTQKSIFALAKKVVENQPPKAETDKVTLSEFLSYFAIDKDNEIRGVDDQAGLNHFIAYQVLGDVTRKVMAENVAMENKTQVKKGETK